MSVLRSISVLEIRRGVKAFFNLEAGVTRGRVPKFMDSEQRQQELQRTRQQLIPVVCWGGISGPGSPGIDLLGPVDTLKFNHKCVLWGHDR